ncbi:hypothetical protein BJX64DRAFT_294624 [Aspergillus heterothallicus]
MQKPSFAESWASFDPHDVRIRRFCLLALLTIAAFFIWLFGFCYAARVLPLASWPPGSGFRAGEVSIEHDTASNIPIVGGSKVHSHNTNSLSTLPYIDIFLGFLAGSTLDAIVVVANFNRPLTQQFHYLVSLRMTVLGILVSASFYSWNVHFARGALALPAIIGIIATVYAAFILATDKLHKLFPTRYLSAKKGQLLHHMRHLGVTGTPWPQTLLLLVMNLVLCLSLVMAVPPHWAALGPPVQIASEPIFLRLVGADKTARYNIIVAPVVLAHSALDWGLRQVLLAPSLSISPEKFLGLVLANRLVLDLHLATIFRNRKDLRWARREVLPSTGILVSMLGGLFLLERYGGIPIVTYIKPMLWAMLCVARMLLHFLPSCHVIAFKYKEDMLV